MRTRQAEREELIAQVKGVEAACARCGVGCTTPLSDVRIVADRTRGEGELIFGYCSDCRGSHLSPMVELLNVDPKDPALGGVSIADFIDHPGARPNRPNHTRWAHIDTAELAAQIDKNRAALRLRACPGKQGGIGTTPVGTSWRRIGGSRGEEFECGSCASREGTFPMRDVAAAVLVGYERSGNLTVARNLGTQLGIVFAFEAGVKKGADRPWAHLDVEAIRAKNTELVGAGSHAPPPHWRAEKVGTVRW